uniref:Uncharacterized protein n=1 Tax=Lactuca sativa TaxID=4236 RepID=A0A9R1WNF7_LACSA|nr:hypothetical protein LSAT_V11C100004110 [Lactuca sativa]
MVLSWFLGPIESCKCIKVPTLCIKSLVGRTSEVLIEGLNGLSHDLSFGEIVVTPCVTKGMPIVPPFGRDLEFLRYAQQFVTRVELIRRKIRLDDVCCLVCKMLLKKFELELEKEWNLIPIPYAVWLVGNGIELIPESVWFARNGIEIHNFGGGGSGVGVGDSGGWR